MIGAVVAFATTWCVLALALRSERLRHALSDLPNERSLHRHATPRFGGLGVLAGVTAGVLLTLWWAPATVWPGGAPSPTTDTQSAASLGPWALWWLLAYLVLSAGSALDDRRSLGAGVRMAMHAVVALAWTRFVGIESWWLVPVAIGLTWSINLYNFMDGADGLAGGMAVFGFGTLAIAAMWSAGSPDAAPAAGWPVSASTPSPLLADAITLASVCGVLVGSALGFLCWNFPPARLFLGDAGSIPLGFAAAALGLQGWRSGLWSPLFPLMVFFPFAFDATLTLLKRIARGERVWEPHRQHLYQRVVLAGASHRQMVIRAYALMALCAIVALIGRNFAIWGQTLIIAGQLAAGFVLAVRIARIDAQERDRP